MKDTLLDLDHIPTMEELRAYFRRDESLDPEKSNQFWNSLSDEDKQLFFYSMEGMTRQQIADKLGYKTHSAITKRLTTTRAEFYKV
ncbi:MAG: hypothetical protein BGN88_10035 [Clostridiales bacterium 43-6]|nr:MAG: hypothetical protein BGN88_10035 [Clostridiales bacterium 43-6]